jgi:hypothetical protein
MLADSRPGRAGTFGLAGQQRARLFFGEHHAAVLDRKRPVRRALLLADEAADQALNKAGLHVSRPGAGSLRRQGQAALRAQQDAVVGNGAGGADGTADAAVGTLVEQLRLASRPIGGHRERSIGDVAEQLQVAAEAGCVHNIVPTVAHEPEARREQLERSPHRHHAMPAERAVAQVAAHVLERVAVALVRRRQNGIHAPAVHREAHAVRGARHRDEEQHAVLDALALIVEREALAGERWVDLAAGDLRGDLLAPDPAFQIRPYLLERRPGGSPSHDESPIRRP